jgi:two-component system response regulator HupR/HoxA
MSAPQAIPHTVLLVDDESLNRDLLRRALIFEYDLCEAADADEAVRVLEGGAPVAAVLCDQLMPGRSGTELAQELSRRWPEVVTVLLTGYEDAPEVLEARRDGSIFEVLAKPCLTAQIRAAVGRAVSEHQRRLAARGRP